MDPAVALVQAYLQMNGYFTVTEYAVVEAAGRSDQYRTSTDLDVLAVRFPGAGHALVRRKRRRRNNRTALAPDPELDAPDDRVDMIIGEVKEGRAELNRGARNSHVLQAVLTRFGCCSPADAPTVVDNLLQHGISEPPHGHRTRLVAFGTQTPQPLGYHCQVILLSHVVSFSQQFLRENWDILRHAPSKDYAVGLLRVLEKIRVSTGEEEP